MIDEPQQQQSLDCDPGAALCDICQHRHACYVGGAARKLGATLAWERHVCLGCLMRASVTDGFRDCAGCVAGGATTTAGAGNA